MPVVSSIDALHPDMQPAARAFVEATKGRLPVRIFETLRPAARQDELYKQGTSRAKAGKSPHNFGLAFDVILDLDSPLWAPDTWAGLKRKGGPDGPWDTGIVRPSHGVYVVEREAVLRVWREVGRQAKVLFGLDPDRPAVQVWGGDWYRYKETQAQAHLGWDAGHIQHPEWKRIAAAG